MSAWPRLAMLLRHEPPHLTATIGVITEDAGFRTPVSLSEPAGKFYDFRVRGTLDHESRHVWAIQHGYLTPYWVDLDRAEAAVRLLRRIHRGLADSSRLPNRLDHVPDGFVAYLERVAAVLRVERLYRRTTADERATTGQRRHPITIAEARVWVAGLEALHSKPR